MHDEAALDQHVEQVIRRRSRHSDVSDQRRALHRPRPGRRGAVAHRGPDPLPVTCWTRQHLLASRIRDTIPEFSLSQWAPVRCPGINTEFDQGKESTVTTVSSTARLVRAPRGTELSCKGWQQEAALRMLMNNLDPEVAEHPEDLVVYGGTGRAARSWEAFDAIVRTLRGLEARRDHAGAVRQAGRRVPHPRVGAARADRELESRWRLGELGAVPQARGRGPDDVRADDGRLVDLHRHPGHPAGHLRDLRRGCEEARGLWPPRTVATRWPARSPSPRGWAAWAVRSRWP